MHFPRLCLAVLVLSAALGMAATANAAVTPFVTLVGDSGNAANSDDPLTRGAVSYEYSIAIYEVTVSEYVEFLNNVAASDPHSLFPTLSDQYTQITRSGSSGSYTYAAVSGKENFPVVRVNWYSALRFVNWLDNGQGASSTESGVYDMTLASPTRSGDAIYALPTMDEWYKAAYYEPGSDGPGTWYDYPTWSNTAPTSTAPGLGTNEANYRDGGIGGVYAIGSPDWLTDVGAYFFTSNPNGTYDQGGNAAEWVEDEVSTGVRGLMGGAYTSGVEALAFDFLDGSAPNITWRDVGFRIVDLRAVGGSDDPVQTPEPATLALLAAAAGPLLYLRRRRRRKA